MRAARKVLRYLEPRPAVILAAGISAFAVFDIQKHSKQACVPAIFQNLAPYVVCDKAGTAKVIIDDDDLQDIVTGKAVVLYAYDFPLPHVIEATKHFEQAIEKLKTENAAAGLKFYIFSRDTPKPQAEALVKRMGLTNESPFVLILEDFLIKEAKYLSKGKTVPKSDDIETMVRQFVRGELHPVRLGQPRPAGDKHHACKTLYEVVTDSFAEIVLDPAVDVLLEAYTPLCDACKAFAPRYRMFSTLCAKHLPKTRIAAMNILDNDRDTAHVPEKWTPSIRLFRATDGLKHSSNKKVSILFDYDALVGSDTTASSGAKKIILPSIPELLDFVCANALHSPADREAASRDAALLEEEAVIIEQAYAQVLRYVQLWAAYNDAITSLPADQFMKALTPEEVKIFKNRTAKEEAAIAKELQRRMVSVHKYIVGEAGAGSSEKILEMLQGVASFVEAKKITERIQCTFEGEETEG